MSHTVTVKSDVRDHDALARAAQALGGRVLGLGTHKLFETHETGFGVSLPGWRFPIVATESGALAYDDYKGRWGNVAQLAELRKRYVIETARAVCERQGWYTDTAPNGTLTAYLPGGGTVTVEPTGTIDVACVEGQSCVDLTAPLEAALGIVSERTLKPEYALERAKVSNGS